MESVCYEAARLSWTLCHVPAGQVHISLQVEPDSYSTGPPLIVSSRSSRHGPVVSYSLSQCWSWHMSKRVQSKIVTCCPPRKAGVFMCFSSNLRQTNRCAKTTAATLCYILSHAKVISKHKRRTSCVSPSSYFVVFEEELAAITSCFFVSSERKLVGKNDPRRRDGRVGFRLHMPCYVSRKPVSYPVLAIFWQPLTIVRGFATNHDLRAWLQADTSPANPPGPNTFRCPLN